MWPEKQLECVELPPEDSDIRPTFEKMSSCDFSVEESYTTSQSSEEESFKSMCGFVKKPARGTYPCFVELPEPKEKEAELKKIVLESPHSQDKQSSLNKLEDNKAALKKLSFETVWKVGAVKGNKSRSPTEHDEEKPNPDSMKDDVNVELIRSFFSPEDKQDGCSDNLDVKLWCNEKEAAICQNAQRQKKATIKKKSKGPLKRQSIGKKKRNKWVILCEEEPMKPLKQNKLLAKKGYRPKVNKKTNKMQCKDSGVSSGGSYESGSSSGGDSGGNDGNKGGGGGGGGGGSSGGGAFHSNGGMGGAGRDDDSDNKRPFSSGDTEMKDEEETDDDDDVKMKSKGDSEMDCKDDSLEQNSIEWQNLQFNTQNLQHSCYCSESDCNRPLCVQMKKELSHYNDTFKEDCARCQKITNLIKLHAATCHRSGCRVPKCLIMRANKVQPQQVPNNYRDNIQRPKLAPLQNLDGKVIYKSPQFSHLGPFFQENIDYRKGELLGKGANGNVYRVQFPTGSPLNDKPMVVKETKYPVNLEEIKVYRSLGKHENIVNHHCVTFKGCDNKTSVLMELCDKSLKDILDCHEMDTNEAMFYWTQVLAAVSYMHDKNILHKDIKAKNVLLSELPGEGEYCRAKLADFDSAKLLETEFTQSGLTPMGTAGFVSPEVLERKPHGRPADIYSMACLLLELKGINPEEKRLTEQVKELYEKDNKLGELVSCCLQYNCQIRPTARELINHPYIQGFLKIPDQV